MPKQPINRGTNMRAIILVAGLVLAASAPASPELPAAFSDSLEEAVEQGEIRAAVVGLLEDGATRVYSFGRIGPANEQPPAGDTAFEIGSVTKVFTALLAQSQVEAERLDWDAPLSGYLRDVEFASEDVAAITLRELATHTSGLPRMPGNFDIEEPLDPYAHYGRDDLMGWLAAYEPEELRKEYAYSNLGMGLLGVIAADAAGSDYAAALSGYVLQPLGLSSSRVGTAGVPPEGLARGYSGGANMPNWNFQALAGAGAMVSTANDMLAFMRENLDQEEQPAMLAAIREPQPNGNTALGWHLEPVAGDDRVYWHNGGTGGYASFLAIRPANRTGLVVLTASTEAQKITQLGLAQVTGRELQADLDLDPYPGTYRLGAGLSLSIFVEDGKLFGQATGQGAFPLTPLGEDTFAFPAADIRIAFERKDGAPAHELALVQGGQTTVAPRVSEEEGPRRYETIELDPSLLPQYAGRYELQPGVIITITAKDGQLYAQLTGQPAFPVFPYEEDGFYFTVVDAQLRFERAEGGAVESVVLHQAGARRAPRID